jgi:hypothetical protein
MKKVTIKGEGCAKGRFIDSIDTSYMHIDLIYTRR